jgi:predicted homoserine dehydrogenase-like protein
MNLSRMLRQRAEADRPIRVGLIGVGKFATMFLAQARHTPGLHVLGCADRRPDRPAAAFAETGWPAEAIAAPDFETARRQGTTRIVADPAELIAADGLDVAIEATGDPAAGIRHARLCLQHGRHLVAVNVEADALAGPLLAREFAAAGLVYSLAYGDQPALICELVDWARASGLPVVAAGKGTKYLESFHASTPDTVWDLYGIAREAAERAGLNPQMFNAFIDGTKSAIEMAAVANATGLSAAPHGLSFPPCAVDDLAHVLRPPEVGGRLHHAGQVEVVSSLERDGRPIDRDLRWGVYVTFAAPSEYTRAAFGDYGLATDVTGGYAALYRPYHLIGLELGISVASTALRGEPTGSPEGFHADVVAVAKRPLQAGETLDGEGGYCVWGRLMPAADSLAAGALPIGLAHGVTLARPVEAGQPIPRDAVRLDDSDPAVAARLELERRFAPARRAAE